MSDANYICYQVVISYIDLDGRGVSNIVFVEASGKYHDYRAGSPDELPHDIHSNKLVFKKEGKDVSMSLLKMYPLLCIPAQCIEKQ